jgi:hypothetical protein
MDHTCHFPCIVINKERERAGARGGGEEKEEEGEERVGKMEKESTCLG